MFNKKATAAFGLQAVVVGVNCGFIIAGQVEVTVVTTWVLFATVWLLMPIVLWLNGLNKKSSP